MDGAIQGHQRRPIPEVIPGVNDPDPKDSPDVVIEPWFKTPGGPPPPPPTPGPDPWGEGGFGGPIPVVGFESPSTWDDPRELSTRQELWQNHGKYFSNVWTNMAFAYQAADARPANWG